MAKKKDFDIIEYLEEMEKSVVDRIVDISMTGKESDAVRLKANTTLLNKLLPDRTKMEVDVRSAAPYDKLLEKLGQGKAQEGE